MTANTERDQSVGAYLERPYHQILVPDPEGGYSAEVLELPGCFGEGDTADEAMRSLNASMASWFAVMLEDGRPIPEPLSLEFSGRIALRLPKDLHRRVALRAQADGISINQFIVGAIEARIAGTASLTFDRENWLATGGPSTGRVLGAFLPSEGATWGPGQGDPSWAQPRHFDIMSHAGQPNVGMVFTTDDVSHPRKVLTHG